MQDHDIEILEKTVCYDGYFRLERYRLRHRLFAGGWSDEIARELFRRDDGAAVLLYDSRADMLVFIEQFRIGAMQIPGGAWTTEIVAGAVRSGEMPDQVVHREAMEEAGCRIEALIPICSYLVSPGGSTESIHLFCGKVDASQAGGIHGLDEEGEDIRVVVMTWEEAHEALRDGRLNSAAPIIALQWLALNRDHVRAQWRG